MKHYKYLIGIFCRHDDDLIKHLEHLHKICEGKTPYFIIMSNFTKTCFPQNNWNNSVWYELQKQTHQSLQKDPHG